MPNASSKPYDTCIQVLGFILKEKSQDLDGHNLYNSSVTALPVELPSPWEQGDGELDICIQVFLILVYKCHRFVLNLIAVWLAYFVCVSMVHTHDMTCWLSFVDSVGSMYRYHSGFY